MFVYNQDDSDIIMSCSFEGINLAELDPHEVFQVDSKWADRTVLYDVIKAYAALTGWKPTLESKSSIKCSCYSRTKRKNRCTREYVSGALAKDCKWQIRIKSTRNTYRQVMSGDTVGKHKSVPVFDDGVPVIISSAKCVHTGTCKPCTQQQIIQRARSGEYIKCISDVALFTLCTIYKEKMAIKSYYIKSILQSQFPSNHNVTKFHVFNMKKRIKMMMPMLENVSNFQDFQRIFKTTKLIKGLDDTPLTDDNIAELGRDTWDELLNDGESEHCFFTFAEYMQTLKDCNSGFDYQLLTDMNGRYTGCIWQTSIMKDNFDRFGGYLSIDAMKRGINKLLWPYMSIAMFNEINCVCVACEAIICSEREEAYHAMIQFVLKNSRRRTNENIHVIAADGFINQDCVTNRFGLPNAIYMCDMWHLFDSILPKRFGLETFNNLKTYLKDMVYSRTQTLFEEAYNKAMNVLLQNELRNENLEENLRKFYNERSTYATYILSKKRGTRGCHGSSISESNHSSVLVHLNDGDKFGNTYCEKPHTLVKDLFYRQRTHINHWNSVLYNESLQLDLLRSKINIDHEPSLFEACSTLCLNSFKRFSIRLKEAKNYVKKMQSTNCVSIKSLRHPDAPPRLCYRTSMNHPFTCKTCEVTVAYEEQCVHSIVANDMMYVKEQFDLRHYKRDHIASEYQTSKKKTYGCENDNDVVENSANEKNGYDNSDCIILDNTSDEEYMSDNEHPINDDDNISFTADNGLTLNEKQASFYEQDCYEKGNVKPMSILELRKVFNSVLSNYESCTEKMKLVSNSIALSLNDITQTDGQACGIFRHVNTEDVDETYASKQIVSIIRKHNNAFLPKKGAFNITVEHGKKDDDIVMESTLTQRRKQKRMRIISNKEKFARKTLNRNVQCNIIQGNTIDNDTTPCIINKKIALSCGFCGSNEGGENISNCRKRDNYRRLYYEYVISKTDHGVKHLTTRFQHNIPLSDKPVPQNIVSMSANANKGKHIVIFNVWLKNQLQMNRQLMSNMFFEISYINKQGDIETSKRTICGEEFESMMHVMKTRQKKTFIYDATNNNSAATEIHNSLTQDNLFSKNTEFWNNFSENNSFLGSNLHNNNRINYFSL